MEVTLKRGSVVARSHAVYWLVPCD